MRFKHLICSTVIAMTLLFTTAFAVPDEIDRSAGEPAAVDSIQKASPAVAVALNQFEVADRATYVREVYVSPPDIATSLRSEISNLKLGTHATGWIPINSTLAAAQPSPNLVDAYCSKVWAPNIGYGGRLTSGVPSEHQMAISGSFS